MINTNELRGIFAKNGYTQKDIAELINVTPKTFYNKMKKGVFGSDEMETMIIELKIEKPMEIFFGGIVTSKDINV